MNKFDDLYFKKAAWLCEASEDDDDEDKVEEDETETDDTAEDADVEAVEEIECPDCDGTGEDEDGEECETCGGTGVIAPEESEEDIVADAEDAISDAEDDDDDAEADPDAEPDPDEEYELDLADPVCPCCGAHLNVISDTETDVEEPAAEEDVPTTEVDGFEVADPSIMGPETNIYYSDEDAEPVEYSEDGEDDDDDVDESTKVNEGLFDRNKTGNDLNPEFVKDFTNVAVDDRKKIISILLESGISERELKEAGFQEDEDLGDFWNDVAYCLGFQVTNGCEVKNGVLVISGRKCKTALDAYKTIVHTCQVRDIAESTQVNEAKRIMKNNGYRVLKEKEVNLDNLVKNIFELLTAYDIEASDNEVKKLVLNYIDSGRDVEHASAEDVIELDLDNEPDSVLKYNGGIHFWIKEGRYNEYFDESTKVNECGAGCCGGKKKKDKKKKKDIDEVYDIVKDLQLKTLIDESEADVTFIYDESVDNIVDSKAYSDLCEALDTLDEIDYEVDDQDPSCLAVWEK